MTAPSPTETVLGMSQAPGELVGYPAVGPAQARRIAHLPGTAWRRVVTDPVTGLVLDRARTPHAARRTPRSPTTSGRPGSAGSAPARDAHTPAPTWTTR